MDRRSFLRRSMVLGAAAFSRPVPRDASAFQVMTVLGPIDVRELGPVLPHEHILVDFVGAAAVSPDRYDSEEVFRTALPHLERAREVGCSTFVDCTPQYIGRDARLLKRLAAASGLHILTNTGYYGAAEDKFVPDHAFRETAENLAQRWIREWRDGIADTGIRPGFIKIGVDRAPLSEMDKKIVQAAGLVHLETGLTIASHTADSAGALEQLEILRRKGVASGAWIWVHARKDKGSEALLKAGRSGAWIEFDSIGPSSLQANVELVLSMRQADLVGRILLSQDAGWYHVGEPEGGLFRPFDFLFVGFLPALRKAGLSEDEMRTLTVRNPAEAFGIRVRRV